LVRLLSARLDPGVCEREKGKGEEGRRKERGEGRGKERGVGRKKERGVGSVVNHCRIVKIKIKYFICHK